MCVLKHIDVDGFLVGPSGEDSNDIVVADRNQLPAVRRVGSESRARSVYGRQSLARENIRRIYIRAGLALSLTDMMMCLPDKSDADLAVWLWTQRTYLALQVRSLMFGRWMTRIQLVRRVALALHVAKRSLSKGPLYCCTSLPHRNKRFT